MSGRVSAALMALTLGIAACGGDNLPKASIIELVSGDGQQGPAGATLSALVVLATTGDGTPVTRARVRWQVVTGMGAVLSDDETISDGVGHAQVVLTLGPAAGSYKVSATLVDESSAQAVFSLTATEPPTLSDVSPATFTTGDLVTVRGAHLGSTVFVRFAGAPAPVTAVAADGSQLTATVPACLPPGSVDVQAFFRGAPSNVIQGTFQAANMVSLAPGEYVSMSPAALAGCATIPSADVNGAEYLFMPQSATTSPNDTASYRFTGDSNAVVVGPPRALQGARSGPAPYAERFHDWLRAREDTIARLPRPAVGPQPPGGLQAAQAVLQEGDTRDFRVCNKIHCVSDADFTRVHATARYVGDHAAIFVDQAAPNGGMSSENLATIGSLFDAHLYDVATRAFGAESDIDKNGHVIILMTPVVNGLTPKSQCSTSVVTGFFFAFDVDPSTKSSPTSNRGEVFYTLTPDPSGSITCSLDATRILNLVPVTFIHEFQHMINYNQHVLVRGGNTEILWLNEGLSHLAEELGGEHFLAMGDATRFSQFVIGDLFDAYQYLSAPGDVYLVYDVNAGTGTLAERGAGWLFLRYLMDQFGDDLSRRLVETARLGADNVVAVFGVPFDRIVGEWALANYVSDLPGLTVPRALTYSTWSFRDVFNQLHTQSASKFPRAFPLEPMAIDGGTFDLTGVLRAGSGDYVRVTQGANGRGFVVTFTNPSGGALPSGIAPRMNVIRLR